MMSDERWRAVPDYEGVYEVSDYGRVRSLGRFVGAKLNSKRWQPATTLSPGRMPTGHLSVSLHRNGRGKSVGVHRLVLLAFVGPCPPGMECCHGPGGPADNRLSNLRWDTRSANVIDQVKQGTHQAARKTRCKNDHPLTEANIYRYGNKRKCKTCTSELSRTRYETRKATA